MCLIEGRGRGKGGGEERDERKEREERGGKERRESRRGEGEVKAYSAEFDGLIVTISLEFVKG